MLAYIDHNSVYGIEDFEGKGTYLPRAFPRLL